MRARSEASSWALLLSGMLFDRTALIEVNSRALVLVLMLALVLVLLLVLLPSLQLVLALILTASFLVSRRTSE